MAAAGLYALSLGGRFQPGVDVLVPLGVLLLVVGLVLRWPGTIAVSVVLIGGAYVGARGASDVVDGWAVAVGAALLLAAELASWSMDHDERIHEEREVLAWRVATLVGVVAVAAVLDVVVLAAAAVSGGAGVVLVALGVGASVLALAFVLRLARAA